MREAQLVGRVVISFEDGRVDQESDRILAEGLCESNDSHVLALARVSRSRLLFTNDHRLQKDFGNPQIIRRPRGRVYTTRADKKLTAVHVDLLSRDNLCRG